MSFDDTDYSLLHGQTTGRGGSISLQPLNGARRRGRASAPDADAGFVGETEDEAPLGDTLIGTVAYSGVTASGSFAAVDPEHAMDTSDAVLDGGRQGKAAGHASKVHEHSHVHHMSEAEVRLMSTYESLDYDTPVSDLYRKERIHLDQRVNSNVNVARWIIFALIGTFTGSLAYLLNVGVEFLSEIKFGAIRESVYNGELVGPFFTFFGISIGYVAFSSFLVAFVEPVAGGSGIPEIKGYLNGTNYLRFLRLKTLVVKAVGVIFSVSAGLAIGKEGPLVHSGAIFAANISHQTFLGHLPWLPSWWHKWVYRFRNDRDKRDFVSGGAAAGVAAAFGSPVGGILFSLEEASSFWSIDLTWRVFLCSMLGTFFLNVWKIVATGLDSFEGLISFGPPIQGVPYRIWETPFFLLLAVFGGLLGAMFNNINTVICRWRRDVLAGRAPLRWFEAVCIGAVTAILSFWAPFFFPTCHVIPLADIQTMERLNVHFFSRYQCPEGQYNSMATMVFTTTEIAIRGFFHNTAVYDWESLLGYLIIIFFLAVVTYGIAVPSGLFVPCILMGCAFGRLMGEGMRYAFPDANIIPGTYALMGATACLGGVARMTISLTVILLETTNDVQFIMPIMIVLMVSKWVGDLFNISLYDLHVELKCMPFVEAAPSGNMYHLKAKDVMAHPVVCLQEQETVGSVLASLRACSHNGYPIVRPSEDGSGPKFTGMIVRNQLVVLLNQGAWGPTETAMSRVHFDDFSTSLSSKHITLEDDAVDDSDLDTRMDLRPFMNPVPITVQLDCPLSRVFVLFRSLGIRHLVVTDVNNEVQGIISRQTIMSSFQQDLF